MNLDLIRKLELKILGSNSSEDKYGSLRGPMYLVAENEGVPVGFLVACVREWMGNRYWHIWISGVLPEYRGKGIYSRLLKEYRINIPKQCIGMSITTDRHRYPDMYKLIRRQGYRKLLSKDNGSVYVK